MAKKRSVFETLLQATQVDRLLRQRAQRAAKEEGGITATEWLVLCIVQRGPSEGVTMSALSGTLGVSRPQVTALVENLLVKRLIRQQKGTEDRRSRSAIITQKGKEVVKQINKAMEASFADLAQAIPGTHIQIYRQVQDEIIRKG